MSRQQVLIVEDQQSQRWIVQQWVNRHFDAVAKPDALAAFAWMQQGNVPDAIVLDVSLPRLSGLDFLRNIRHSGLFARIPVIILSAESDEELHEECRKLGVKHIMSKPFDPKILLQNIGISLKSAPISI